MIGGHIAVMRYDVNNIYATIQGEGHLCGTPMILVRMHGCPVGCPFCDTKQTWGDFANSNAPREENKQQMIVDSGSRHEWLGENERWTRVSPAELVGLILAERRLYGEKINWVMITGGEPAMQNLIPLATMLREEGINTQLESSGTATGMIGAPIDWVCISPKIGMPGRKKLEAAALAEADEVKFVIGREEDVEKMDAFYKEFDAVLKPDVIRSLQPMSASKKATDICTKLALQRNWHISIQTHKIMGIE